MCGICGIVKKEGHVPAGVIFSMSESIRHRGPDEDGLLLGQGIGMGHRRLSIVDLEGGKQPMTNEDGSVWVVFNGEIYNHAEIRPRLERKGHIYRTRSDTETLIHLYEEKGLDGVHDLRGMFACSIWDSPRKRVILIRDRLGIKPLYYFSRGSDLVWASEIKAILSSGLVKPRLRLESLPEYLANGYTSGENTLFEGVKRLLPGSVLLWENGRIEAGSYWRLPGGSGENRAGGRVRADVVREFRDLFRESVRVRMMSDVPLGMFLSGGIDSSAIAAEMRAILDGPFKTFSVAFDEREANELHYARMVSRLFGTEHHETVVSPDRFFGALPHLVWHEDEPIAFPSSVPLYFISKAASEHVKVVLTGEGSDELLGGYARYRKTLLNLKAGTAYEKAVPGMIRKRVREAVCSRSGSSRSFHRLSRSFLCVESDPENIFFDNFSVFSKRELPGLLFESVREEISGVNPYRIQMEHFREIGDQFLNRMLHADMHTYLQELLMKQDQMSMAASIESRVPFLDHKLVEFVAGLEPGVKIRKGTTKCLLREAMSGVLPEEIIRRRKMGFPVPLHRWFRDGVFPPLDEFLLGERAVSRQIFNIDCIRRLLGEHRNDVRDHSARIWSLLNLEIWQRIFLDGEEAAEIE
ncbi:MAG: asparagine synthase (glutamine-hydrolyzing) [Syntrophales bacterium]|nr:asparagine synthase (glutamine-hydrolyzing) [Syntrophales bacterium]